MKSCLITLCLLTWPFAATAQKNVLMHETECTEVYKSTHNLPKNNNQKSLGWCYAFATANALSIIENKTIDPLHLATKYLSILQKNTNSNSNGNTLIKHSSTPGKLLETIQTADSNLDRTLCLENSNTDSAELKETSSDVWQLLSTNYPNSDKICKPGFNMYFSAAMQMKSIIAESNVATKLDKTYTESCKNNIVLDRNKYHAISVVSKNDPSKNLTVSSMNDVLNMNTDKSVSILQFNAYALQNIKGEIKKENNNNHFNVILGRKFNKKNKRCEFQMRNSWGNSGKLACGDPQKKYTCVNDLIWIDEKFIHEHALTSFHIIKKK